MRVICVAGRGYNKVGIYGPSPPTISISWSGIMNDLFKKMYIRISLILSLSLSLLIYKNWSNISPTYFQSFGFSYTNHLFGPFDIVLIPTLPNPFFSDFYIVYWIHLPNKLLRYSSYYSNQAVLPVVTSRALEVYGTETRRNDLCYEYLFEYFKPYQVFISKKTIFNNFDKN